jgi:hypothetical protein
VSYVGRFEKTNWDFMSPVPSFNAGDHEDRLGEPGLVAYGRPGCDYLTSVIVPAQGEMGHKPIKARAACLSELS